jgi:type IV secretory pathway VirD2 relaxase
MAGFWAGVQAVASDEPRLAELDAAGRAAAMRERRDAVAARVDGAVHAALVAQRRSPGAA